MFVISVIAAAWVRCAESVPSFFQPIFLFEMQTLSEIKLQ